MSHVTALLDANVLYPAPIRDILLQLTVEDLFRAKWTADIHREWIEALLRNEPHRDRVALERTRTLMDSVVRDALITAHEALIETLVLPDPDDRHVLAAVVGRCDVTVTQNRQDFPEPVVKPYGIETQHPIHVSIVQRKIQEIERSKMGDFIYTDQSCLPPKHMRTSTPFGAC